MAWGTDFIANVYLNRMIFNDIQEVNDKIDENNNYIDSSKQKIKMFVSSTPNSIVPDEWKEEPITWLNTEIDILFDSIIEATNENILLNQYVKYLEDKNKSNIE